jgi:3-phenylpropionate/trans-cinnamate dioxygenase ferredoxin reductase component
MAVIAIVGANLAGGRAAEALRGNGFDGRIVLLGEEEHAPYERPPLSKQGLAADIEPAWLRGPEGWAAIDVELRTGDRVVKLSHGSLLTASGHSMRADQVLLATGGHSRPLGVPGGDLPGVHHLRTHGDAARLRGRLRTGARVVVIGGGFIGAEVAAAAVTAGCAVTVVEVGPVLMLRGLGPAWGEFVTNEHRRRGVRVLTRRTVTALSKTSVELDHDEVLAADVVVVGVGMAPNVELARDAGARVDGGIVVDAAAATSVPGVWAAGDVTVQPGPLGPVRYESWQNAAEQAGVAAAAMLGRPLPARSVPWFWSDQYDLNLQTAGRLDGTDAVVVRGDPGSASFSAFHLLDGRMVGVFAVNRGRDVRAATRLIARGAPVTASRLADESIDLRRA